MKNLCLALPTLFALQPALSDNSKGILASYDKYLYGISSIL